jgi:hypothetical protein
MVAVAVDRPDDEGDRRLAAPDSPVAREAVVTNTPDSLADRPDFAAGTARVADYRATVDAVYRAYVIDQGCARAREIEETIVTPAMRNIESEDPTRDLVGLYHCLKSKNRIEEKICHDMQKRGVTAEEAFAAIKDTIRYTFCYPDDAYAGGVRADCARLKDAGFELADFRNSWTHGEYKGINSRWRVPENGQLFEVQFHTQASFEAKENTHTAYERLRILPTSHAEVRELRAYQRGVTAKIPIPPEAPDVAVFLGASDVSEDHLLRNRR